MSSGNVTGLSRLAQTWKTDTWVRPFFARYAGVLALALALGVAAFVFAGALMFTSGYMISLAAALPLTVLALHVPSLFVRIFGIGKPILQYFERLVSHDWALRMTSELRRRLYDSLERAASPLARKRRLGEVLGVLSEDIGHIQNLYLRSVFPLAAAWLMYVVVVVATGAFSLPVAGLLAVMLGVVVVVLPLASVCVNGARRTRAQSLRARLYDELTDNVLGVADWVFSGRSDDYLAHCEKLEGKLREAERAARRFVRVRDVAAQVLFGLCVVGVLVWAAGAFDASADGGAAAGGFVGALAGVGFENAPAYAANWIAAFALCFFPLIEAFAPAPAAAEGFVEHGAAVERLNGYPDPDAPREQVAPAGAGGRRVPAAGGSAVDDSGSAVAFDGEPAVSAGGATSAPAAAPAPAVVPAGAPAAAPPAADIVFDRVTFAYDAASPLIRDVSLRIPQGSRLAVLGRSGAGKSTLATLLRGELAPREGSVTVAGREAGAWGDEMVRLVGIIQQKPNLFHQTLRENLLIGRADATDEELERVMADVGLASLLKRLPQGLDTMVDEAGQRFSGGERHRIALARVLLSHVPVVVLDEPFAGLDPATERALIDVMFEQLEGRTVVMITHHLQGVGACDRVVLLEDGAFAIDGAPGELARTNERYRRLLTFDRGQVE
ncbi:MULTISPECIES: thiol reductant ABC exporter subunit CydC [unclassified Adlercreutzia]|uniref:thiol reductant ABC exporter subunit CydC n=1 Tax=unclassified Adlercreutzia TaxID=2636013 RepID=UPI001F154FC9|nr:MULTISPECIES: thiol reductant ABC exporter subunit CydC [unclassified Adlercreutzia]